MHKVLGFTHSYNNLSKSNFIFIWGEKGFGGFTTYGMVDILLVSCDIDNWTKERIRREFGICVFTGGGLT